MVKEKLFEWLEFNEDRLIDISLALWDNPEISLEEHESANLLMQIFENEGFDVTSNIGGMSTAFSAKYGDESPHVGVLGEYDALPDLSQQITDNREPVEEGTPGHGCGHNLLAAGSLGGALAIKEAIENGMLEGTVTYFGCPAEEVLAGKVYMAKAGAFDPIDAALAWHPGRLTTPWLRTTLAVNSIEYKFKGVSAHSAKSPESGRSALDAVQLMNVGTEYIREHISDKIRVHYVIKNGGDVPNVVPAESSVWYFIRAPNRKIVEKTSDWLRDIAEGAALMTQTELERVRYYTGCYDYLPNDVITNTIWKNMGEIEPIRYSEEDVEFANNLKNQFSEASIQSQLEAIPEDIKAQIENKALYPEPIKAYTETTRMMASSDVGDVSWIAPTGQFWVATWPVGVPGHTWPVVAANGSFGKKGIVYAAKVIAGTAFDLMIDESLLKKAKTSHEDDMAGRVYQNALPDGTKPPTDLVIR